MRWRDDYWHCHGVLDFYRRQLSPQRQVDAGFFIHFINVVLAYALMLAIMTYSLELFICSILGLLCGHILSIFLPRRAASKHGVAPQLFAAGPGTACCAAAGLEEPLLIS